MLMDLNDGAHLRAMIGGFDLLHGGCLNMNYALRALGA